MFKIQAIKVGLSLLLGFAIGIGCHLGGIPSPAPTILPGALLVVAMTTGWILTDRWLSRHPKLDEEICAGPSGKPKEPS